MWFITQCFGVGFRGSHQAGDSVPLPGPPDPPDMAPDPHDEGDFEGPDTRSLMDEFMDTFPFRDTVEVCSELQAERERLLDPDGTPRDRCKERVYIKYVPTLFLSYDDFMPSIYRLYSCHMTTSCHLYTNSIILGR